jgi:hypothetical protein
VVDEAFDATRTTFCGLGRVSKQQMRSSLDRIQIRCQRLKRHLQALEVVVTNFAIIHDATQVKKKAARRRLENQAV